MARKDSKPFQPHKRRRPQPTEADRAIQELEQLGVLSGRDRALARQRARSIVSGSAAVRMRRGDDPQPAANSGTIFHPEAQAREAAMVISAMEAAVETKLPQLSPMERQMRRISRATLRVRAELALWADGEQGEPWSLFTRDLDTRAMGFICQDRLPLGYGGTITLTMPDGRRQQLEVTVTRCRPCSAGWYEGALHFNHPQAWLVDEIREQQQMRSGR